MGIGENLAETTIFKDSFIFGENGHCFEKGSFASEVFIFGGIVFFW